MKKEKPKMFIVRKYIKAISAAQAIKKDRETPVHDCWIDEKWGDENLADAIGFHIDDPIDEE